MTVDEAKKFFIEGHGLQDGYGTMPSQNKNEEIE
jgi:hypothetical protein